MANVCAQEVDSGVALPEFLQLVGHPLRWRLLGELAQSDRMVHELTGLVGQPQNLVSYHLGKLRDACLVSARRSSADRRDAYYTVDLTRFGDLLSATGGAPHPRLPLIPQPSGSAPTGAGRGLFFFAGTRRRFRVAAAKLNTRIGFLLAALMDRTTAP